MAQSNDMNDSEMCDWRSSLKSRTSHILEKDFLSDVTVKLVGYSVDFHAHSLLLSLASPVLEKEISKKTVGSKLVIRVNGISPDQFQKLMRYIYTDDIQLVNVFEAQELFHVAKKFEMDHLEQICFKYIDERKVDPASACKVYETALDQKMEGVVQMCLSTFMMQTKDVLRSPGFLDSRISTVEDILKMDCLNIDSEIDIIEAVMKWVCAARLSKKTEDTPENVREMMLPLLRHIRFLTLECDQIHDFIVNHDVLSAAEACAITVRMLQPNSTSPYPVSLCPINSKRRKPEMPNKYFMISQSKQQSSVNVSNDSAEIQGATETLVKDKENQCGTSSITNTSGEHFPGVENCVIPKKRDSIKSTTANTVECSQFSGMKERSNSQTAAMMECLKSQTAAMMECSKSETGTMMEYSRAAEIAKMSMEYGKCKSVDAQFARMSMDCGKQAVNVVSAEAPALCIEISNLKSAFATEFEGLFHRNPEMCPVTHQALAEVKKSTASKDEVVAESPRPLEPSTSTRKYSESKINDIPITVHSCDGRPKSPSENSSGEDEYEDTEDLKDLKSCDIDLDTENDLPDGARASDISSDADISVIIGRIKIVGLEFHVNVAGITGSLRLLIQVNDGKKFYECPHDVLESNIFILPEKVLIRDKQKVHVKVIAENLQLKRCPLAFTNEIHLKDTDDRPIEFIVKLYGNQKIQDMKIPYIIKRILYRPWYE